MKIITIEEHFQIAEIKKAVAKYFPGQSASHLLGYNPPDAPLEDLGAGRLQRMDAMDIDVQVLSYTPAGLPAIPAAAAALEVPIYLHPSYPPKAVQDACYAGLDPAVSARFATAGWGWHLETGTHALHMILAGVFDRYPGLQLILGHWGEMIPFYLDRFAEMLS